MNSETPKIPQYKIDQRVRDKRLHSARLIASDDVNMPLEGKDANQFRAIQGSGYVAHEGEAFVRRARPKVKGKAAKKAWKKARHAARERIGNSSTP